MTAVFSGRYYYWFVKHKFYQLFDLRIRIRACWVLHKTTLEHEFAMGNLEKQPNSAVPALNVPSHHHDGDEEVGIHIIRERIANNWPRHP